MNLDWFLEGVGVEVMESLCKTKILKNIFFLSPRLRQFSKKNKRSVFQTFWKVNFFNIFFVCWVTVQSLSKIEKNLMFKKGPRLNFGWIKKPKKKYIWVSSLSNVAQFNKIK